MRGLRGSVLVFAAVLACEGLAWDVEHDEVAQLVGENLPDEVRRFFGFDDFGVLMANCHFPDGYEWERPGKSRLRGLEDVERQVGARDAALILAHGFKPGNWLHREEARGVMMGLLARAFAEGARRRAAFYVSVISHQVSDESALNHSPLLQFVQHADYDGVEFGLRKVEERAKNVFGFRSDGFVVNRVREKLRGFTPQKPSGTFEDEVFRFVTDAVRQAASVAEKEGAIAFGSPGEARETLADLVSMQVRTVVNMVWAAWKNRSADAPLPDAGFAARCEREMDEIARTIDPSKQAVFATVFDAARNPAAPKGVVGVVCEPYAMFSRGRTSYVGRLLAGMCAGTLRANGFAVRGVSYFAAERDGLPEPSEVPALIFFTGGTGSACQDASAEMAARLRAYRDRGGRLLLVGGSDARDISGFAGSMRMLPNGEGPTTSKWFRQEAGDVLRMSVADAEGKRLLGGPHRFVRDPNIEGFCKPVCRVEIVPGKGVEPLVILDNGVRKAVVAGRRGNVTWAPAYLLSPWLLTPGPARPDFSEPRLDAFGEKALTVLLQGKE